MGFRLERELRFAGCSPGTTSKLGAPSRYQALFVLAIFNIIWHVRLVIAALMVAPYLPSNIPDGQNGKTQY